MKSKKEKSKSADSSDNLTDDEFREYLEKASMDECLEYLEKNAVEIDHDLYASPRTKQMKAEGEKDLARDERDGVSRWIQKIKNITDISELDEKDIELLKMARSITERQEHNIK